MTNKELLNERRIMDYFLIPTECLFEELCDIISSLEQTTRSERICETTIKSRSKKTILVQERDLTTNEIINEIDNHNLIPVVKQIKNNLMLVDNLSFSYEQLLNLLDTLPHIEIKHYFKTLMCKNNNSVLIKLNSLKEIIKGLRSCGYGNPEQYNQLFYFVVNHSIKTINQIIED